MTRQYRWQIEQRAQGLCVICAQPAVVHPSGKRVGKTSPFCLAHLRANRERRRANQGCQRRNRSLSYALEKGAA